MLNLWREKCGPEEVQAWAAETVKDDKSLVELLEKYLQIGSSISSGDAVAGRSIGWIPNG